jgi:hypothetical protein
METRTTDLISMLSSLIERDIVHPIVITIAMGISEPRLAALLRREEHPTELEISRLMAVVTVRRPGITALLSQRKQIEKGLRSPIK